MGLEIAEIVMDVEDAFGIHLDDHAAWDGTVGGLVSLARAGQTAHPGVGACLTGCAFKRIRSALLLWARDPQARIRPSSRLDEFWDRRTLGKRWRDIELDAGLALPATTSDYRLGRRWLALTIIVPCAAIAGMLVAPLHLAVGAATALVLLLVGLRCLSYRSIPRHYATVGDLARAALGLNAQRLQRLAGPMGAQDAFSVIQAIVAERLGLAQERVRPESHLVKDLGAG